MIEVKSSGEEFKNLAVDMIPVIKNMEQVLKKHGVESLASLSVGGDGYFTFSHAGTRWDLTRICKEGTPRIRMEYTEELEWEV